MIGEDHVAKNLTEGSPEAANDTGLFAVANGISAYNMAVDSFSVPTIGQSALQSGDIALRTTLCVVILIARAWLPSRGGCRYRTRQRGIRGWSC